MQHKFEADSILLDYGSKRVLSDIYIQCETGKITGILGGNGQGKSSLMNVIYGNADPISKSIRFDGVSVFKAYKRSDLITYLPQFSFLPSYLTLRRIFSDFGLNFSDFLVLFPEFSAKYNSAISRLSGGERRLMEVYVILKSNSRFSLLDEPFSHLMPIEIEKITELLKLEKGKKGFMITDHLFQYVIDISEPIYLLKEGQTHLIKDQKDIHNWGYTNLKHL